MGINKPQGYLHQAGISCVSKEAGWRERERWLCSNWPPLHGPVWMAFFVSSFLFPKALPPQSWWWNLIHRNIIHKNTIVQIKLFQTKRCVFVFFFCNIPFLLISQMALGSYVFHEVKIKGTSFYNNLFTLMLFRITGMSCFCGTNKKIFWRMLLTKLFRWTLTSIVWTKKHWDNFQGITFVNLTHCPYRVVSVKMEIML